MKIDEFEKQVNADIEDLLVAGVEKLARAEKLRIIMDALLLEIVVPERNCSCHLSPPCNDCLENGALRELVEEARAAIKQWKLYT